MDKMYFDSVEEYQIEKKEYCFLKEDTDKSSESFKVYMAKLLPLLDMKAPPKQLLETYNNNIYLNATECKVDCTNRMMTQNYLTIQRRRDAWFRLNPEIIQKYTRLTCDIPDKNIRRMLITDEEFNVDKIEKTQDVFVLNPLFEFLTKIEVEDSIKFLYKGYTHLATASCPNNQEHYINETHDRGIPDHIHHHTDVDGGLTIEYPASTCKIVSYTTLTGIVSNIYDWGVAATSGGITYQIPASNVIGFYKKAGQYYSFYNENKQGG